MNKKRSNQARKQSKEEEEDVEQDDDDDVRKTKDSHRTEDFEDDNPFGKECRTTARQHP